MDDRNILSVLLLSYLDKAYPDKQVLVCNNFYLDELMAKTEELHQPFAGFLGFL